MGRHLTKRLLQDDHSIWILDNLSTGANPRTWIPNYFSPITSNSNYVLFAHNHQKIVFIEDDAVSFFSDQLQLGNRLNHTKLPPFDDIYHLASVVGGRATIEGAPITVAIDLAIDALFFQWIVANKNNIGRVLYASSSAAYPINLQSKHKTLALKEKYINFEDNLGMPDMTYGWSKLTGEYLSQIIAQKHNIHVACVRPFSGYGGDQDQTYPIPAIARRAANQENPLIIWGTGEQGRDFVHIDDCIEAMLLALNNIQDGNSVNIGTGTLTTFKQVATMFAQLAEYSPEIKPLVNKPEGVQSRYCDPSLMKKTLNWKPQISLKNGFAQVLAEQKKALINKNAQTHQPIQS